jgi:hypothetical protein
LNIISYYKSHKFESTTGFEILNSAKQNAGAGLAVVLVAFDLTLHCPAAVIRLEMRFCSFCAKGRLKSRMNSLFHFGGSGKLLAAVQSICHPLSAFAATVTRLDDHDCETKSEEGYWTRKLDGSRPLSATTALGTPSVMADRDHIRFHLNGCVAVASGPHRPEGNPLNRNSGDESRQEGD